MRGIKNSYFEQLLRIGFNLPTLKKLESKFQTIFNMKTIIQCFLFLSVTNISAQLSISPEISYGKTTTSKRTNVSDDLFPATTNSYLTVFKDKEKTDNLRFGLAFNYKLFKNLVSVNSNIGYTQGITHLKYYPPFGEDHKNGIKNQSLYLTLAPEITLLKHIHLAGGLFYERVVAASPKSNIILLNPQNLWGFILNPSVSYKNIRLGYRQFVYKEPFFSKDKVNSSIFKNVSNTTTIPNYYWKTSNIYLGYSFFILNKK